MSERSERNDLSRRGKELAAALGVNFDPKSLSNVELAARVQELKAAKAEADAKARREEKIAGDAKKRDIEDRNAAANEYRGGELKYRYQLAPGRRWSVEGGELRPGAEITAEDCGGQEKLDELVESGVVLTSIPRPRYEVAPGRTLQCRAGKKGPGERILPEFVGGLKQLKQLEELGSVVKVEPAA